MKSESLESKSNCNMLHMKALLNKLEVDHEWKAYWTLSLSKF